MSLGILIALVFFITAGLIISCLYFFIQAPSEKKKLRQRLEGVTRDVQAIAGESESEQADLLLTEMLSEIPLLNRLLMRLPGSRKLNLYLRQADIQLSVGMLITLSLLSAWCAFLIIMLLSMPVLLAILVSILVGSLPFLIIAIKRQKRFIKFEEQFPDAMDLLSRAVRAGHAFTTGLDLISKEMPKPISQEFRITYEQQNLGLPLRDALRNLANRIPLTDVRIFITALSIQRDSGGNLAEILDNLSLVIRERFKLIRQIRVYTAQGRLTLYFLVAIPPLMAFAMFFLNPEYLMPLFTDPLGLRFLTVGIVLQVIGYFVIRKITQPKF